jgi:transcriptional regulator with XRE-family HTH domain/predicted Fe-Mo cluster-binding NifX family protein
MAPVINKDNMDQYFAIDPQPEILLGLKLRELRTKRKFSLRALAERSGLNVNTLSLLENGKTSPSVSTLHQLAMALNIPIAKFFEVEPVEKHVVFTPHSDLPENAGITHIQNLGIDLAGNALQQFLITLKPGAGSGDQMIVHTGHEFVYCLSGKVHYRINKEYYVLQAGDSLVFEAHIPHCWENDSETESQILLVLAPADESEEPGGRHFSLEYMKKEFNMKIALITDDGKTISQHFGRAAYYLVMTIEDGKIVEREMRDKMGHTHIPGSTDKEAVEAGGHGMGAVSHSKHVSMAEVIADCKVLLCGGMGRGAYQSMEKLNITPIVSELRDVEEAAQAFIDGKLVDHTELLH